MAFISAEKNFNQSRNAARAAKKADRNESRVNYEKIRLYNFRIPNRFTKDQLRALRGIYENFSSSLSSHLSGLLRKFCQVELLSVEEHTFSEFNNAISDPVLLAIIELSPSQGISLMEISPALTCGIIDRLMGGSGQYANHVRNYTEIEVALMERLTGQLLEIMKESWSIFYTIQPKLERIETRSQFAQIVPLNETIAIITFSVKMGEVEGFINYCLPHVVIEALFKDAKTKTDFFEKPIPVQESKALEIKNKIEKTPLEMIVAFKDTSINAKEVMELQVGDVLALDHKVNEAVNVKVKGKTKFKAYLGIKNNHRSVKLINKIDINDL